MVITDAYAAYRKVTQESYHHGVINHSVVYADGCVHTNTIGHLEKLGKALQ